MTMIYADIVANAIFVDSGVTSGDGRRLRNNANKIHWCANGVSVMSGLLSAALLVASTLDEYFKSHTDGKITHCSIEFQAFGENESGDGFLLSADGIYSVIYMHGHVTVTRASVAAGDSAGSGQTWFNVLRECGHKPTEAFSLVLKHHSDCCYPAYVVSVKGNRLVIEELTEGFQ